MFLAPGMERTTPRRPRDSAPRHCRSASGHCGSSGTSQPRAAPSFSGASHLPRSVIEDSVNLAQNLVGELFGHDQSQSDSSTSRGQQCDFAEGLLRELFGQADREMSCPRRRQSDRPTRESCCKKSSAQCPASSSKTSEMPSRASRGGKGKADKPTLKTEKANEDHTTTAKKGCDDKMPSSRAWSHAVSLPGFAPNEIHVKVRNGKVHVHARQEMPRGPGTCLSRLEIHQTVSLPDTVDGHSLSCAMRRDGTLLLRAPVKTSPSLDSKEETTGAVEDKKEKETEVLEDKKEEESEVKEERKEEAESLEDKETDHTEDKPDNRAEAIGDEAEVTDALEDNTETMKALENKTEIMGALEGKTEATKMLENKAETNDTSDSEAEKPDAPQTPTTEDEPVSLDLASGAHEEDEIPEEEAEYSHPIIKEPDDEYSSGEETDSRKTDLDSLTTGDFVIIEEDQDHPESVEETAAPDTYTNDTAYSSNNCDSLPHYEDLPQASDVDKALDSLSTESTTEEPQSQPEHPKFHASLPLMGFNPREMHVKLDGHTLTISAQRHAWLDKEERAPYTERVERQVDLPEYLDLATVRCLYEDSGYLVITAAPKRDERQVPVELALQE